ncbi:single-stranded DNA-binding protein [Nocardioides montaniterrae]
MSNETMVTIRGWLAADPVVREANGFQVANFRVGCTPRRFNRARQEWVDGRTQWYSVAAWRDLAVNCGRSLKGGEPVIVHGRLEHRTYTNRAGQEAVALEIDAITVGHDLTRGIDNFLKAPSKREQPLQEEVQSARVEEAPEDPWAEVEPAVDELPSGGSAAA